MWSARDYVQSNGWYRPAPSGGGGGGASLVTSQVQSAQSTFGGSTVSAVLPNNPTPGNTVIAGLVTQGASASIADGAANPYVVTSPGGLSTLSSAKIGIYRLDNVPGGASKTVTATIGTPSGVTYLFVAEFTGLNAASFEREGTPANFAGPGTNINTPSVTSTNNGDVLFAVVNGYDNITAIGSPWTAAGAFINQTAAMFYVQPTAAAQAANATQLTSTRWDGMIAAFHT